MNQFLYGLVFKNDTKENFTTNKKNTCCKRPVCHVTLEFDLINLPCTIEFIVSVSNILFSHPV